MLLVVGVEMGLVMGLAKLPVHSNHDTVKASQFRHMNLRKPPKVRDGGVTP